MTCIVGIAQGGRVWLGGDSAGFLGGTVLRQENGKVFRQGEYVIGCAGNHRMSNLLRFAFKPPAVRSKGEERHMAVAFTAAVRKALREHGYLKTEDGRETTGADDGDHILVGFRGKLYFFSADFAVTAAAEGLFAIGCGQDFALGSLYSTKGQKPESRIRVALEAAERYSEGVVGPFHIVSTK